MIVDDVIRRGCIIRNAGIGKMIKCIILLAFLLGINGCAVYTVPTNEFDKQTAGTTKATLRHKTVRLSVYGSASYLTNDIDTIFAYDKKGNVAKIPNGPRIEIRFTLIDSSTKVFYFDTIYRDGRYLHGLKARLLDFPDSIMLDSIAKIEIQDGRKNYSYE